MTQSSTGSGRRADRRIVEHERPDRPARSDYDRILYSYAFRRLGDVTQVVAALEGPVFHNRLTHSLRVAQIARAIAQKFLREAPDKAEEVGGIDPDVAGAAGLAHDLGHPPFGHIAEEELRSCVAEGKNVWDGFEGNAQSFRIVTKLASPGLPGLNLTRATLNAILKYPWTRQPEGYKANKYGLYQSEREDFEFARELQLAPNDERKSPEAEIMDWADDVTYALHDAEDFYQARLIPLDRLASLDDSSERRRFFDGMYERPELKKRLGSEPRAEVEEAFFKVVTAFPISGTYVGTREHQSRMHLFSSLLRDQFVHAIELHVPSSESQSFVKIRPLQRLQVRVLKALTWFYVILSPELATQQYGQRKMIRELFEIFGNAVVSTKDSERNIIPLAFRDEMLEARDHPVTTARFVSDLISGMTEQGIVKRYRRLTGIDMGSVLDYSHGN
jgi:dGTPase